MATPLLLSIASLYLAGLSMIFAGIVVLKKRLRKPELTAQFTAFGLFWLIMGVMLGPVIGTRNLLWGLGYPEIDKILYDVDQVSMIFIFPLAYYYIFSKVIKKTRIVKIIASLALILASLYLFFYYKEGAGEPIYSEWGSEYGTPPLAKNLMIILIAGLYLTVIYDLISQFIRWIGKKVFNSIDFWPSFTIFLMAIAGIGEGAGLTKDWKLLLFRMIFVIGAFIVYLCFTGEEKLRKLPEEESLSPL